MITGKERLENQSFSFPNVLLFLNFCLHCYYMQNDASLPLLPIYLHLPSRMAPSLIAPTPTFTYPCLSLLLYPSISSIFYSLCSVLFYSVLFCPFISDVFFSLSPFHSFPVTPRALHLQEYLLPAAFLGWVVWQTVSRLNVTFLFLFSESSSLFNRLFKFLIALW